MLVTFRWDQFVCS